MKCIFLSFMMIACVGALAQSRAERRASWTSNFGRLIQKGDLGSALDSIVQGRREFGPQEFGTTAFLRFELGDRAGARMDWKEYEKSWTYAGPQTLAELDCFAMMLNGRFDWGSWKKKHKNMNPGEALEGQLLGLSVLRCFKSADSLYGELVRLGHPAVRLKALKAAQEQDRREAAELARKAKQTG